MTVRSVCGVKLKSGKGLLGGVVAGLLVVRSVLSTQVAAVIWRPRSASSRLHRFAAVADVPAATVAATARTIIQRISSPLDGLARLPPAGDGALYRNFASQPIAR